MGFKFGVKCFRMAGPTWMTELGKRLELDSADEAQARAAFLNRNTASANVYYCAGVLPQQEELFA